MKGEAYLQELLSKLSLEEKVAQLLQLTGAYYAGSGIETGPDQRMAVSDGMVRAAGSILNVAGAKTLRKVQEEYLKRSPNGIPMIFMADIINGYRTVMPIMLGQACSFDPELVEQGAAMAAREGAADGLHVTFSPMADLCRDARWGRVMESTGEDVWLNEQMAAAMVRGYQGEDLSQPDTLASCAKHFAGYGAPEGGREYNSVDMSEKKLREEYLKAYRAAVDAGCELMMTSFNTLNGIPSSANCWLNRQILRKEWGFKGVLISDYSALAELVVHGAAENEGEAARLSIEAGVDMDMVSPVYADNLTELVKQGAVSEELVDEAVLRILRLKDKLGLFENPYRCSREESQKAQACIGCEEHRSLARKLAEESFVLLKNDGVLPFRPEEKKRIAVIGPFAQEKELCGSWSLFREPEACVSLAEALEERYGAERISCARGCCLLDEEESFFSFRRKEITGSGERQEYGDEELLSEAEETARGADVILLTLGEHPQKSGEGAARSSLALPRCQQRLLERMAALGKPVAVLVFSGRPVELLSVEKYADAVMMCWFPGTEGGNALANVISGQVNPSGKLAMSIPYTTGQEPIYYSHLRTGRPAEGMRQRFLSGYQDVPPEPLHPFGYGLSYTTFSYEGLQVDDHSFAEGGMLLVTGRVTNTGRMSGTETVLCYVQDVCGSTARPVRELKGAVRLELEPGETKEFRFSIPEESLRFYAADGTYRTEPGVYRIYVGDMTGEAVRH